MPQPTKPGPGVPPPRTFTPLDKVLRLLTMRGDFSLCQARAFLADCTPEELAQMFELHDQPTGRPDQIVGRVRDRQAKRRAAEAAAERPLPGEASTDEQPAASLGAHSPDGVPDLDPGTVLPGLDAHDVKALHRWEDNGAPALELPETD